MLIIMQILDLLLAISLIGIAVKYPVESPGGYYKPEMISNILWLVALSILIISANYLGADLVHLVSCTLAIAIIFRMGVMLFFIMKDGIDAHFTPLEEQPQYIERQIRERELEKIERQARKLLQDEAETIVSTIFTNVNNFLELNKYEVISKIEITYGDFGIHSLQPGAVQDLSSSRYPLSASCRIKRTDGNKTVYENIELLVEYNLDVHFAN